MEQAASEWRPGSGIAELNRFGAAELDPDTAALLARSLELAALTDGAFDPTWAAYWGAWDFERARRPSPEQLRERAERVGYERVLLEGGRAEVEPETLVGLGGIAKGWALERAAEALEAEGHEDFCLRAGGQVLTRGQREGRPWVVGVQHPRGEGALLSLELGDGSLSTSGDYERFFVAEGRRYHHVLDPATGWPAAGVASATVLSADAADADALSTALMVMGPARGLALVETLEDAEALVLTPTGQRHRSPGWPD